MKTTISLIMTVLVNFCCFSQQKKQGSMLLIPSKNQSFIMGVGSNELLSGEPAQGWAYYIGKHKVSFTYDFYMDSTLVTQNNYQKVIGNNPSNFKSSPELPVEQVTWYDAVLYCNAKSKLENLDPVYTYTSINRNGNHAVGLVGLKFNITKNGYRLPTNAEYEFAERAKTTGTYFFSPNGQNLTALGNQYAWSSFTSGGSTKQVATKKPNPWGLYDLVGNVFEWCNDWDNTYILTDEVDPIGKLTGSEKIAKGGSYKTDIQYHMRIPYHYKWGAGTVTAEIGFRTVRTLVACSETPIIPNYKINGGNWMPGSQIKTKVGDTISLRPVPSVEGTWQWQGPSAFSSSLPEVILAHIELKQEGNYNVQYKNSSGCTLNSIYTIQFNNIVSGLSDFSNLNNTSVIYPNPFSNNLKINIDQKYDYSIYSLAGHMMEQGSAIGKVDVGGNLMTGSYILKIKSQGKDYSMKIEKE